MASVATKTAITSDATGAIEPSCSADVKTSKSADMERGSLYDVQDKWSRESPAEYLRLCELRATMRIEQQFQSKDSTEHPVRQLPTGSIEHSDPGTTKSRSCAAAHRARPCEPNITPDTRRQPGAESGNVHVTLPVSPKRKLDECTQTSPKETPGGKKHKGGGSAASIGSQISSDVIDLIITNMAGTATSVSIPTISTRVDSSQ